MWVRCSPLTRLRSNYLDRLEPELARTAAEFLPELGAAGLRFLPGWRREDSPLEDALLKKLDDDNFLMRIQATSFYPQSTEEGYEVASRKMDPPRYPRAAAQGGAQGTVDRHDPLDQRQQPAAAAQLARAFPVNWSGLICQKDSMFR